MEHSQARFTCTEAFPSFEDVKEKVSCYFITKRFGLNARNYLLRDAWEYIPKNGNCSLIARSSFSSLYFIDSFKYD